MEEEKQISSVEEFQVIFIDTRKLNTESNKAEQIHNSKYSNHK